MGPDSHYTSSATHPSSYPQYPNPRITTSPKSRTTKRRVTPVTMGRMSALFLLCLASASRTAAQSAVSGQFVFVSDALPQTLPACSKHPITLTRAAASENNSTGTPGTPPFYMLSFEVGGTPLRQELGADADALEWEVRHAEGATLLLNVVDSSGSGGGIPARLFRVSAGSSTSCIPPAPSNDFVVWTNASTDLETCAPLGIAFDDAGGGGGGPYALSIVSLDSRVVTNVTVGARFDAYTYVNRAPPGSTFAVGVADGSGRWAKGTPLINTIGATDTTCAGRESSPGNWTQLGFTKPASLSGGSGSEASGDGDGANGGNAEKKESKTGVIVGVVVGVLVLLLGGAGVWWFLRRRRRASQEGGSAGEKGSRREQATVRTPVEASAITPFDVGGRVRPASGGAAGSRALTASKVGRGDAETLGSMLPTSSEGGGSSYAPYGGSMFSGGSLPSPTGTGTVSGETCLRSGAVSGSQHSLKASEAATGGGPSYEPDEVVIQHRDGGPSIRELPPPYVDNRGRE